MVFTYPNHPHISTVALRMNDEFRIVSGKVRLASGLNGT